MLSYRREDSKWIAGRIFDRLENHYGKGNVFMDIDTIPVGLDFRDHLQQSLQRCDILLAIVGPRWLGTDDEHGHHAIWEEDDWVRIEIESALAKNIPVVPVLIDRLRMPKASELPESLRNFAFRQAAEVDSGVDFRSHMERLIRSMDQHLQLRLAPSRSPSEEPTQYLEKLSGDKAEYSSSESDKSGTNTTAIATVLHRRWAATDSVVMARFAAGSWIGIWSLLLASELMAFLGDQIIDSKSRTLFIVGSSLPLGASGLLLFGRRFCKYLISRGQKFKLAVPLVLIGIAMLASVPTVFDLTEPPIHYPAATAWPIILIGGFGLMLVVAVPISQLFIAQRHTAYFRWLGLGFVMLGLGVADVKPTSAFFPGLDWRVRAVLIFTFTLSGTALVLALAACAFLRAALRPAIWTKGKRTLSATEPGEAI
jgi:hypothetical protein